MKLMGLRGRNASWGLAAIAALALTAFVGLNATEAHAQDAPTAPGLGAPELGASLSAGELLSPRTRPAQILRPAPENVSLFYPPLARRLKKTGRAVLACDVNSRGDVGECAVVEEFPIGWGFGQAARRIASDLRATPAQEQGRPVGEGRVIVPVTFIVRPVRAS